MILIRDKGIFKWKIYDFKKKKKKLKEKKKKLLTTSLRYSDNKGRKRINSKKSK